ncbi:hypothetical protein SUGI_0431780 [Cryptomeria japonica]|nr:hypothetical protein SUGI_0431780 [Cryptomeria japonica]
MDSFLEWVEPGVGFDAREGVEAEANGGNAGLFPFLRWAKGVCQGRGRVWAETGVATHTDLGIGEQRCQGGEAQPSVESPVSWCFPFFGGDMSFLDWRLILDMV